MYSEGFNYTIIKAWIKFKKKRHILKGSIYKKKKSVNIIKKAITQYKTK